LDSLNLNFTEETLSFPEEEELDELELDEESDELELESDMMFA
jgi:hypothetical protein